MAGSIGILNVGAGDTKIVFDKDKPEEFGKSKKVLMDLFKKGFAVFVQIGTDDKNEAIYRRATSFDEQTNEYVIPGPPAQDKSIAKALAGKETKTPKPKTYKPHRVAADRTHAVGVARTAGG